MNKDEILDEQKGLLRIKNRDIENLRFRVKELEAALQLLLTEMDLSGNAGSKDYGWPKAIAASRAALTKAGL